MKVGIDASCWANRRGFGRFTRELLTALVARGTDREWCFFADETTCRAHTFPANVETIPIATSVSPTEAASGTGRRSIRDVWAMTRAVRRHDLDLFFFPAVYSWFPILNRRTKTIVTIHDVIAATHADVVFGDKRTARFWRLKEYLARKQADLILTVSDFSRRSITEHFKLADGAVRAISEAAGPHFAPRPADDASRRVLAKFDLENDARFLLYVGAITPYKNLPTLIDAFADVARDARFGDVRLLLVGDYANDPSFLNGHAQLSAKIRDAGLESRVTFPGFVPDDDLAHLYSRTAAFVLPSVEEGFGLTALEALQCGAPVAASRRGSLLEVVGDAGLLFEPDDPADIAAAITRLLSDDALGARLRVDGPAHAATFSWQRAADETNAIFDEVAG